MTRAIQWLGGLLAILALAAVAVLIGADLVHGFAPTSLHGKAGALALMLSGGAYMAVQCARSASAAERARAVLLGAAFVLWGGEQFIPPSRLSMVLDSAVVGIFVVDLCLIIAALYPKKEGPE